MRHTATETNSDHFEVQKSTDEKDFFAIGQVAAKGTTTHKTSYQFADPEVKEGQTYYYRIKQVNHDSNFSFSKAVTIKVPYKRTIVSKMYPNPAKKIIHLSLHSQQKKLVNITLSNIIDETILTMVKRIEKGQVTLTLPLHHLSNGVYYLKIKDKAGRLINAQKIIKQ